MADLLVRSNILLKECHMLEGPVGDAFGMSSVFSMLHEHGIQRQAFARTRVALDRLRDTIDQLDQLPP